MLPERIRTKYSVDPSGCWNWMGAISGGGYGQVWQSDARKNVRAHRLVYEILTGPIDPGKQLDHLCRNRRCVNPAHLEPVSCRENLLRGETRAAKSAAATECPRGHAFDAANTLVSRSRAGSQRQCRACARDRARARRAR